MTETEKLARANYFAELRRDPRFVKHIGQPMEALAREANKALADASEPLDRLRYYQGQREVIDRFEDLFEKADRLAVQVREEKENARSTNGNKRVFAV